MKGNFDLHLRHNPNCLTASLRCFTCQKCQESFCELYQLQDHIRKHEQLDVKRRNNKGLVSNNKLIINRINRESLRSVPVCAICVCPLALLQAIYSVFFRVNIKVIRKIRKTRSITKNIK